MRAAVTRGPGGPIAVEAVPDPVPAPGDVVVRVHAASLNRLDRAVYDGTAMGGIARFPLIQGADAAGVVEDGDDSFPAGLRVAVKPTIPCGRCRWCLRKREADCDDATTFGIHRPGGWAEFMAVPRSNLVALPDDISFEEGAAAAHSHAVVLRMIRASGVDPAGAAVLVTGASGALGTAAIQLTRSVGATVLASTTSAGKRQALEALGASRVLLAGPDLGTRVREETDGIGVDLVLETTGRLEVIDAAGGALARGGRFVVVGAVPGSRIEVDVQALYRNRHAFVGSASSDLADFADTYRLLDRYGIRPAIAGTYPLEMIERALADLSDRERIGRIVIDIEGAT